MLKNADGSVSELHTRTNASGVDLVSDSRIAQAWDAVRDASADTRWCLAVYADGGGAASGSDGSPDSNVLAFLAAEAGGLSELCSHLSPRMVAYGVLLVRVGAVRKPVFLTWVGEQCGALHRTWNGPVYSVFVDYNITPT